MGILIVYDVTDEKSFNSECFRGPVREAGQSDMQTSVPGTSRSNSTLPPE